MQKRFVVPWNLVSSFSALQLPEDSFMKFFVLFEFFVLQEALERHLKPFKRVWI
jgi:hypothetical protein